MASEWESGIKVSGTDIMTVSYIISQRIEPNCPYGYYFLLHSRPSISCSHGQSSPVECGASEERGRAENEFSLGSAQTTVFKHKISFVPYFFLWSSESNDALVTCQVIIQNIFTSRLLNTHLNAHMCRDMREYTITSSFS